MKSTVRIPVWLTLLLPLLAFSCREPGISTSGHDRVVLRSGEVHEGWYFAGGNSVVIDGTVNGDAFICGGIVDVTGTINGELFVAGGDVNVSGQVRDRIIAAGGTVRLMGKTEKSVIAAGGSVILVKNASVGENFLGAGGNLMINGTVHGNARLASGKVDIAGEIQGDVDAAADRFWSEKGAVVGGNLTILTKDTSAVEIAEGSTHGKVIVKRQEEGEGRSFMGMSYVRLVIRLLFMLSLFVTALVLSFLFPGQTASIGTTIMLRPGRSALVGVATLILSPILAVVLCITVIGVPIAVFAMMLYFWMLYLSQLSLGVALGSRLIGFDGKRGWKLFGTIAMGLIIVDVLMFIPWVNVLTVLAGLVFGVGALAIIAQEQYLSLRSS